MIGMELRTPTGARAKRLSTRASARFKDALTRCQCDAGDARADAVAPVVHGRRGRGPGLWPCGRIEIRKEFPRVRQMALSARFWRPLAVSLAAAVLVAGLGVSGCGSERKKSSVSGSMAAPIVAATVNGKPIYIADVESEAVAKGIIREGEDFEPNSDVFYQVLEDLIESRLLAMEAERRELDRNADVRHRLERARDLILSSALSEQIRETAIDEAEVEKMYREQVRLLRGKREVHLRHAVFATKDAALAAKRRLDAGQSTFEEVAYDLSTDRRTGPEGGDMGFQKPEDLPDGLRQAVQTAQPNEITGPIQTGATWQLFRIEERREADVQSLDSMRPRIEQWLMFEELRRVVDKLKVQARIERVIEEDRGVAVSEEGGEPRPRRRAAPREGMVPIGPGAIAGATGGTPSPAAAPVLGGPEPPAGETPASEPPRRRPAAPPATAPATTPAVAPPIEAPAPAAPSP